MRIEKEKRAYPGVLVGWRRSFQACDLYPKMFNTQLRVDLINRGTKRSDCFSLMLLLVQTRRIQPELVIQKRDAFHATQSLIVNCSQIKERL